MKTSAVVFIAVVAVSMISSCAGLQCYVCTTANHTACEFPLDPERAEKADFIKTCPEATKEGERTLCRTTHQTVLEEVRIIRDCGTRNSSSECEGSRNTEVVVTSCQCFTDLCNSAGLAQLAPAALLLAAALRAIY